MNYENIISQKIARALVSNAGSISSLCQIQSNALDIIYENFNKNGIQLVSLKNWNNNLHSRIGHAFSLYQMLPEEECERTIYLLDHIISIIKKDICVYKLPQTYIKTLDGISKYCTKMHHEVFYDEDKEKIRQSSETLARMSFEPSCEYMIICHHKRFAKILGQKRIFSCSECGEKFACDHNNLSHIRQLSGIWNEHPPEQCVYCGENMKRRF